MENLFCELKNWIYSFLSMPPSKTLSQILVITLRQKEIIHIPKAAFFENLVSSQKKGGNGRKLWESWENNQY